MIEASKINVVRAYLEAGFPDFKVQDSPQDQGCDFSLTQANRYYLASVANEVFQSHDEKSLKTCLEGSQLVSVLRKVGQFRIVLTNSGCLFDTQPRPTIYCQLDGACSEE